MRILMQIANGYRNGPIEAMARAAIPSDQISPTEQFVQARYGAWIKDNLGSEFAISDVNDTSFTVEFTHEDDALAFQKQLGGRIMEG